MNHDHLIARVADQRIAMAASDVQCVIELGTVVPVPGAPPFIIGLATQRSRTLTVFDVAVALGLPARQEPYKHAVVVEFDGVGYALAVDAIESVIAAIGEVRPVKANLSPEWSRTANGMIETSLGAILSIDLTKLVDNEILEKAA